MSQHGLIVLCGGKSNTITTIKLRIGLGLVVRVRFRVSVSIQFVPLCPGVGRLSSDLCPGSGSNSSLSFCSSISV